MDNIWLSWRVWSLIDAFNREKSCQSYIELQLFSSDLGREALRLLDTSECRGGDLFEYSSGLPLVRTASPASCRLAGLCRPL